MSEFSAQVAQSKVNDLLAALAAAIGQPLELDRSGQCALAGPDNAELVIAATDAGMLSVRTPVARAEDAEVLRAALAINYGGLPQGVVLALDDVSGQIMLLSVRSVAEMSSDMFLKLVAELLELEPALRTRLAQAESASPHHDHPPAAVGAMVRA
jgi:hypothetical protein